MPRKRGRRKKFKLRFNIRTETLRSTVAILLLVISGVILVSFLFGEYSVNKRVQEILLMVFGYLYILLVPIFLILGLWLINTLRWRFIELRILIGLIILLISGSSFWHIFYLRDNAYEIAKRGGGGGLIGYKIAQLLESMISIYGAGLILLALMGLAIIIILDKSIDEILEFLISHSQGLNFLKKYTSNKKGEGEKKKVKEKDTEIKISSGISINKGGDDGVEEEKVEPEFEIIPSLSEPKTKAVRPTEGDSSTITSLASPNLPYSDKVWETPPLDLLNEPPKVHVDRGDVTQRAKIIEEALESFGIKAKVKDIRYGPSVTQYALETESGTKIAKIANLQYDLALALASPTGSVRIEAPIPGRSLIGIEVPNNNRITVHLKELLTSEAMKGAKHKLRIILGLDVGGKSVAYNISKMPHLLIAGATGSGKSIFIHSLMSSILFRASPQEVKFLLVDPKRVELVHYEGIPHLLAPVIKDIDKAASTFRWLDSEMRRRYRLLETARVRNIEAYNEKSGFQALPYIVLIVDEFAEIMMSDPSTVEKSIVSLAQLARATGIHLVLALQRPSTNVITGLIKANIPCRISFNVTSQVDSRVIIDQPGAEKLLGQGDMLFVPPDDSKPLRLQGAMVTEKETTNLVGFLKSTNIKPTYKEDIFSHTVAASKSISAGGKNVDKLFEQASEIVINEQKGSASLLQRRLSIGYSRAARILDELEAKGIVGPQKGSKAREVLVKQTQPQLNDQNYELPEDLDAQRTKWDTNK